MKTMNILRARTPALLVLAVAAFASRSIASSITVIPPGLAAGSQYRLVFVTADLYTATSANIATYNNEVNAEANSVGALAALGTTWLAIGSTATVNAIDNIGQDPGVPIYNLGGQLVADDGTQNTGGLFSGTLINLINYFDSGAISIPGGLDPGVDIWSGSSDNGLVFNPLGTPDGNVGVGTIDHHSVAKFWLLQYRRPTSWVRRSEPIRDIGGPYSSRPATTSLGPGWPHTGARQLLAPWHSPLRPHSPPRQK